MRSENKNFLFNTVYQLLTFIIPLITTPYISRVLGVENVGIYSYTYSVVYMFMLAGMLGINNYGNRSIAAVRDDKEQMSRSFASIYLLQLGVCLVALIGYSIYLVFFCKEYKTIAVIQGLFLLSVCFDINWFYFGIEKFKLTIFRNLIIKLSSLALIFIFVKISPLLPGNYRDCVQFRKIAEKNCGIFLKRREKPNIFPHFRPKKRTIPP